MLEFSFTRERIEVLKTETRPQKERPSSSRGTVHILGRVTRPGMFSDKATDLDRSDYPTTSQRTRPNCQESQVTLGTVTSRKRKKPQSSVASPFTDYTKNPFSEKEKADQQLSPTDADRFPNLYCELRFPTYRQKNLNIEKKLAIPADWRQSIETRIEGMGLAFVDRELGRVNTSQVQEFYCNFFKHTLDSVKLRGRRILITEAAIEDALRCLPKTSDTDAFMQAEVEMHCMTYDYDALRSIVATPDAHWEMDADNKQPKGMLFAHLTREARTWQQILSHYVMLTTHFTEIPVDMLVLISCIMEGKEVYFPRLIKKFMWRAHV
ncbi:hypothetical protein AHAS_Ahas11G0198900 [Arachis hypogaea]